MAGAITGPCIKVAVQGCAHGELDNIYATIEHMRVARGIHVDLLLCCGDFQAVRNEADLKCMACPDKYKSLNTFYKYYSGEQVAPVPTIFVGGNHEASNYLWDLSLGGWVAPKIYYLGNAGVIRFKGLRIAGLSGIYKDHDYHKGHFERAPYDNSSIRSVYHIREYDVRRLLSLTQPVDVFLSHDWPKGIARHGNMGRLTQRKPFLKDELESNILGSPPAEELLHKLKPSFWFSAHLHVKFAALVQHTPTPSPASLNNGPSASKDSKAHAGSRESTRFLALDKCLPGRHFLQMVEIPVSCNVRASNESEFELDEEWLTILRAYAPYFPLSRAGARYPPNGVPLEPHRKWVLEALAKRGGCGLPESTFCKTAPAYSPSHPAPPIRGQEVNPQTTQLLDLLGVPADLLYRTSTVGLQLMGSGGTSNIVENVGPCLVSARSEAPIVESCDPNEIALGDEEEEEDEVGADDDVASDDEGKGRGDGVEGGERGVQEQREEAGGGKQEGNVDRMGRLEVAEAKEERTESGALKEGVGAEQQESGKDAGDVSGIAEWSRQLPVQDSDDDEQT